MFQQGELGTSEHDRVVLNHDMIASNPNDPGGQSV